MTMARIPRPPAVPPKLMQLACLAVGIKLDTALSVWQQAHRFQSWRLADFVANPASVPTTNKARRVAQIVSGD